MDLLFGTGEAMRLNVGTHQIEQLSASRKLAWSWSHAARRAGLSATAELLVYKHVVDIAYRNHTS